MKGLQEVWEGWTSKYGGTVIGFIITHIVRGKFFKMSLSLSFSLFPSKRVSMVDFLPGQLELQLIAFLDVDSSHSERVYYAPVRARLNNLDATTDSITTLGPIRSFFPATINLKFVSREEKKI